MKLSSYLSWRYLFSRYVESLPLLMGMVLFGTAAGVFALIVVFSTMQGFQKELSKRWIGFNAHLTIFDWNNQIDLENQKGVKKIISFVEGEIIVQTLNQSQPRAMAAKIRGVDAFSDYFLERAEFYPEDNQPTLEGALLGADLAYQLGVDPTFGDSISLVYPLGEVGPTGDFLPRRKDFKLSSTFKSGLYQWDGHAIFISLKEAKKILGEKATNVQVYFSDLKFAKDLKTKLHTEFPDLIVKTFGDQNNRLFQALKLERATMVFLLFLFGLIASFSITGFLMIFIHAKAKDLALMNVIGLTVKQARALFFKIALFLGGLGSMVGGLLAFAVIVYLKKNPIYLPESYYLEYLPINLSAINLLGLSGFGLFLVLVSAAYPIWRIGKLKPLELLHEE